MKCLLIFAVVWGLLMVLDLPGLRVAAGAQNGWLAGVARVDITPQEPMWLAGYAARDHPAEGTLHPLFVKALALKDGEGHQAVLITSDVLGFPKDMSDRIRGRIEKQFQLSHTQIILSSSHTHSGPVLGDSLRPIYPLDDAQIEMIGRYSPRLEDQVVECAGQALGSMKPARLFSGNGVTRFAVNRRNNPEAAILDTHDLKGPSDHAAPVLKVAGEDGVLMAVAFGYACHATVLASYQWCGDYPGFAQIELEKAHPGATALFFAGCGADQNALPRRTVSYALQYGRELAAAVERMLSEGMNELSPVLKTEYKEVELALEAPPTREQLAGMVQTYTGYMQRGAQAQLKLLDEGKPLRTSYPYPVQLWRIGDQTLVVLGGEVVVDYALFLKQMLGRETFVLGYCNDLMSYVPSVRVLHEGGYEGATAQLEYGMPTMWADDIESRILNTARELATKAGAPLADSAQK